MAIKSVDIKMLETIIVGILSLIALGIGIYIFLTLHLKLKIRVQAFGASFYCALLLGL